MSYGFSSFVSTNEAERRKLPLRTSFLMVLAFLLIADYRWRAIEIVPSITVYEFVAYLIPLSFFLDSIVFPQRVSRVISGFVAQNKFVFLYFLWAFFAVVFAFFRLRISGLAAFKDLIPSAITYFAFSVYLNRERDFVSVFRVLLFGAAVNSILGICQGIFGGPYPIEMNVATAYKMDISGRVLNSNVATGFFPHPNGFGLFLIPPAVISFNVAIGRLNLGCFWRKFCCLLFPLIIASVYFSQAKGAMAWLMISIVLSLMPLAWGVARRWIGFVIVFGLIFSLVFIALQLSSSYHSLVTMVTRFQLWEASTMAIISSWDMFLVGSAQGEMILKTWITTSGSFVYPNAHNGIINQAIFYGVPSLLLYLLSINNALGKVASVSHVAGATRNEVAVSSVLFGSVLGLFGEYFFEPTAEGVLMQAQFFMLLGMCAAVGGHRPWRREFCLK